MFISVPYWLLELSPCLTGTLFIAQSMSERLPCRDKAIRRPHFIFSPDTFSSISSSVHQWVRIFHYKKPSLSFYCLFQIEMTSPESSMTYFWNWRKTWSDCSKHNSAVYLNQDDVLDSANTNIYNYRPTYKLNISMMSVISTNI